MVNCLLSLENGQSCSIRSVYGWRLSYCFLLLILLMWIISFCLSYVVVIVDGMVSCGYWKKMDKVVRLEACMGGVWVIVFVYWFCWCELSVCVWVMMLSLLMRWFIFSCEYWLDDDSVGVRTSIHVFMFTGCLVILCCLLVFNNVAKNC